jgi:outer membrane receptor for ferrienterochelin and colicin
MKQFLAFTLLFISLNIIAQDTTITSVFSPYTNEIINRKVDEAAGEMVNVANLSQTKKNEAPGSIHIITAEEIEKKGYRDLIEVLVTIPGFNIVSDVQNGTSMAIRGAYAGEAKILVMIDGLILNEMAYGSMVLGGRLPLSNIERIEIIAGASSSVYGGIAGLGVINIITKSGRSATGNSFLMETGFSQGDFSNSRITFTNNSYLLNKFEISVCGSVATGHRSNKTFLQADSSFINYSDSSDLNDVFLHFKIKRKGSEYQMLYEDYSFQAAHEHTTSVNRTLINDFSHQFLFGRLEYKFTTNLKVELPWNTLYGDPAVYDLQSLTTIRAGIYNLAQYNFNTRFRVIMGLNYFNDQYRFSRRSLTLFNGKKADNLNSLAAFTELNYNSKYFNIYAGARFDYYESFKPNFAPRFAITKEFKHIHYKLIHGQSFKIPTLQNINIAFLNTNPLVPELMIDNQIELGWHNPTLYFIGSVFRTEIKNVIVFGYDLATLTESYINNGNIKFAGYELQAGYHTKKLNIKSSFSTYTVLQSSNFDFLVDTSNLNKGTLAISKYKINLGGWYAFNTRFNLNFNYVYLSKKSAVDVLDLDNEIYGLIDFPPTHLINLGFQVYEVVKFTDLRIGVNNILNQNNFYPYPSASGYQTSIGMGREVYVQVKLNLQ